MLKSPSFSLCSAVGKIAEIKLMTSLLVSSRNAGNLKMLRFQVQREFQRKTTQNPKLALLKFTLHSKLKSGWLIEMKRTCFTPLELSRFCAELFTEDSFEQNLTARSMLGRYFKPKRLAFQNETVPTIFSFPMERCKAAIGQTNDEK